MGTDQGYLVGDALTERKSPNTVFLFYFLIYLIYLFFGLWRGFGPVRPPRKYASVKRSKLGKFREVEDIAIDLLYECIQGLLECKLLYAHNALKIPGSEFS